MTARGTLNLETLHAQEVILSISTPPPSPTPTASDVTAASTNIRRWRGRGRIGTIPGWGALRVVLQVVVIDVVQPLLHDRRKKRRA